MTAPPPGAWQRIWGDDLAAVRPGSADHAAIEAWWDQALAALPPIGRALEIGAGAVPLPSLRLLHAQADAETVASDFRPIAEASDTPRLTRIGDASIEALPFANAAFDLLLSQFAFEYAAPEAAAREARRVLRAGGTLLMIVHHGAGFFADYLAHRVAFLDLGARASETIAARALAREVRAARLRKALREAEALIATYVASPGHRDVADDLIDLKATLATVLAGRAPDAGQARLLADVGPALALARAQQDAGFDADTIAALVARLEQAGFAGVRAEPVGPAARALAWGVSATAR